MTEQTYILGHGEAERARLEAQGVAIEGATRAALAAAGLGRGMRVLDLGCGTGAVSAVAAELVGPTGRVVGLDRDAGGFPVARELLARRGLSDRVELRAGLASDPDLDLGGEVDALVGRLVLMYAPDPARTLADALRHVRPGGLVAFQEITWGTGASAPRVPSVEAAYALMREAFRRSGLQEAMGDRLARDFRANGIAPTLSGATFVEDGGSGFLPAALAGSVRSCLPTILDRGIATEAEVDVETLEARMRAELDGAGAVIRSPLLVACWGRRPGGAPAGA